MSIDKAITYLKKKAPKGEFLAYINPKEAAMLKKAGGSGELVNGIPSYRSAKGMASKEKSRSYSRPSSNPSPRGPQELGTSTRTKNRITAPAATTRIGGKTYNVTPETRGDRDRATLKQQLMRQPLGGNKIDRFGNTKKPFFPQGGGGIGQLLMSILGFAAGIPGLGLAFSKKGMNFINEKFRGTNPDGSIRTQAQYEQSMEDKRAQNRLDKLFAAKDRGYNQIGFGDFTKKTVDFTPGQQAKIDELLAQGYLPSTARDVDSGRGSGLRGDDLATTIKELAIPNINNNDFRGTTGQSPQFNTVLTNEFGQSPGFNASLINEFGQSPQFNTALMNEFGTADRGIMDSNAAFAFGLPYGTSDQGFVSPYGTVDDQGANLLGVPEMTATLPNNNYFAGNYSQNEVGNQLYGKEYDLLNPFEQQQIDKAIETYGTRSTGELA